MAPQKLVIIDCDCGTDDAQAIMLALSASDDCTLLAVTCVAGNTSLENVCRNVLYVLDVCGKPVIPVYSGCAGFMLKPFDKEFNSFHGRDGLGDTLDLPKLDYTRIQAEHASNALVRLSKERPGEITLVVVGPATNVALAQKLDADFSGRLRELYVMGGNTEGKGNMPVNSEFNIHCDPEAAHILFNEFECPRFVISWEACLNNYLSWEWTHKWVNGGASKRKRQFLKAILERPNHRRQHELGMAGYYCCDGYAVIAALEPSCVTEVARHYVTVELEGKYSRAQMIVDWRDQYSAEKMEREKTNVILKLDTGRLQERLEGLTKD